jgi:hypothetical protein
MDSLNLTVSACTMNKPCISCNRRYHIIALAYHSNWNVFVRSDRCESLSYTVDIDSVKVSSPGLFSETMSVVNSKNVYPTIGFLFCFVDCVEHVFEIVYLLSYWILGICFPLIPVLLHLCSVRFGIVDYFKLIFN